MTLDLLGSYMSFGVLRAKSTNKKKRREKVSVTVKKLSNNEYLLNRLNCIKGNAFQLAQDDF